MSSWSIAAAVLLSLAAVLHSFLGERFLIGPLLLRTPDGPLTRTFARRTIRWAWHLTSVAMCGLAAIIVRPDLALDLVAISMVIIAIGLAIGTRGAHFAWPLFAAVAGMVAVAAHGDALVAVIRRPAAFALAAVLSVLALWHLYWAAGGRVGLAVAVPAARDGSPLFRPGAIASLAVAAGLAVVGLSALAATEILELWGGTGAYRFAIAVAGGAFVLRAVGDGRYCGFFKRRVGTAFAEHYTAVYTPLSVALGLVSFAVAL
jgi:hypothetical protein